ncbi:MAG: sensor histidine kinase [Gammaproteobacteria bacterium]
MDLTTPIGPDADSSTAPTSTGFPWRRFAADARYVTVLNVLCAVLITAVTGRAEDLGQNLLFSVCIGSIAFGLIDGTRLALASRQRKLKLQLYVPLVIVCAAFGQYAGSLLAARLMGWPVPSLTGLVYGGVSNMLVITLLISGGICLVFISRERLLQAQATAAKEKARAEAIARQAAQTQLRLLQAQIEPHMLFNTLANVQGLIAIDPQAAQHMLDQFIVYLRATLTSSRAERTTPAQEFALLDAYLGLMTARMGARLRYALDLPAELRSLPLPPMLLQPLVENAIRHGLEPKIDGGVVSVSAHRDGDCLILCVADTGLGLAGAPLPGTRVGLANTRERLHALFGEAASVSLEPNDPVGAVARLVLPVTFPATLPITTRP